jgi:taurine dioxygenase
MSLVIERTAAPVGAFVSGADMSDLARGEQSELYRAFLEHGVLIFKGLRLGVAEHMKLTALFGEMDEPHSLEELRHAEVPAITVLAANNGRPVAADDADADKIVGTIPWHADKIYTATPNRGALLRAVVIPAQGGNTGWIDTARVYRQLPYRTKCKIQGLSIVHSYETAHRSQSMVQGGSGVLPETIHPLIIVHPETNQPALNISPATATRLLGLPEDDGKALLSYLIAFATNEADAYIHQWEPGDLVAWDNLRAIHRAYGHAKRYPRVMHSVALKGDMRLGREVANGAAASIVAA